MPTVDHQGCPSGAHPRGIFVGFSGYGLTLAVSARARARVRARMQRTPGDLVPPMRAVRSWSVSAVRHREEVLNVELARILGTQGVVATPEQVRGAGTERRLPDITVVDHQGLRTTIEGKYAGSGAEAAVLAQARSRVEEGIAQIALAVLYPVNLRSVAFAELGDEMSRTAYRVTVVTEAAEVGPIDGGVDEIGGLLRRGFSDLLREDIVAAATEVLEAGVETFAKALLGSPGAAQRVSSVVNATADS